MSGPETEESNGWNGIGLTRGAAVKKKIRSNTSLFMYSGLKKVPYGHMVVWDKYGTSRFSRWARNFKRYLCNG